MRIVLVGFGRVGQSLARILVDDRERLLKNYGFDPQVVAVIDSRGGCRDNNGLDLSRALETKGKHGSVQAYHDGPAKKRATTPKISDIEADVLIETTPSNYRNGEPGLSNIKQALSTGKHVVTTNKGPLALAMPLLLELAEHRGKQLRFSGTVGGGTPYLNIASRCLAGDKIREVQGILNGTTNYILTRMDEKGLTFQEALNEAKNLGYAEKNPTNDIKGIDTAAKLVIISNWVLKKRLNLQDVDRTGIVNIALPTIMNASESGKRIRLVGRLNESGASVKPEAIPANSPLCVSNNINAVTFTTEHAGDITLIGRGAGGDETASAVIRDLVDIRGEYSN